MKLFGNNSEYENSSHFIPEETKRQRSTEKDSKFSKSAKAKPDEETKISPKTEVSSTHKTPNKFKVISKTRVKKKYYSVFESIEKPDDSGYIVKEKFKQSSSASNISKDISKQSLKDYTDELIISPRKNNNLKFDNSSGPNMQKVVKEK